MEIWNSHGSQRKWGNCQLIKVGELCTTWRVVIHVSYFENCSSAYCFLIDTGTPTWCYENQIPFITVQQRVLASLVDGYSEDDNLVNEEGLAGSQFSVLQIANCSIFWNYANCNMELVRIFRLKLWSLLSVYAVIETQRTKVHSSVILDVLEILFTSI